MGSQGAEGRPLSKKDDELILPRSSLNKVIKNLKLPVRVSLQSKDLIRDCCTEFIQLISSEASKQSKQSNMKTINPEHVIAALDTLGFAEYKAEAEAVHKNCKVLDAKRRRLSTRLENLGIPEEELLRQQQELFAKAKAEQAKIEHDQWMKRHAIVPGTSASQVLHIKPKIEKNVD